MQNRVELKNTEQMQERISSVPIEDRVTDDSKSSKRGTSSNSRASSLTKDDKPVAPVT